MKLEERLALILIDQGMTVEEIKTELGIKSVVPVLQRMRLSVLPGLDAICPRPLAKYGYIYRVIDKNKLEGLNFDMWDRGHDAVTANALAQLGRMVTELGTATNKLDSRTKEGKLADIQLSAVRLAYDALKI